MEHISGRKRVSSLLIYKVAEGNISTRKPKKPFVAFRITGSVSKEIAKHFVKGIVTEVNELNYLKNDLCFLMEELFGEDYSVNNSALEKGSFFYVWTYLSYPGNKNVADKIYPFDVIYVKRELSNVDITRIISTMKGANVTLHHRRLNEIPVLPFPIAVEECTAF